MMIRPKKLILPAVLVLIVVAIVAWSVTRRTPVESAVIGRGTVRDAVEEEGRTRVVDRFVLSAPVTGRLKRVEVLEDDTVEPGTRVAEIDPLSLSSALAQAEARIAAVEAQMTGVGRRRPKPDEIATSRILEEAAGRALDAAAADLEAAEATEAQAIRDADRDAAMAKDGTITPAAAEAAVLARTVAGQARVAAEQRLAIRRLEVTTAKLATEILGESARDVDWEESLYAAQIEEVRAGLKVLRDDLRRAEVVSPVAGRVLRRFLESEQVVQAGEPILEVGSLETLQVEADLLSEDAARMQPGTPTEVFGRALGDKVVPGRLLRIYPAAFVKVSSLGVEQQRVTVVSSFDRAGLNLGDRYRVDLRVILDERTNAVLVPEAALFRSEGAWRVFRIDGGRARLTTVETGLRDGRVREVTAGLSEGDRIVMHPDSSLTDGLRVEFEEAD